MLELNDIDINTTIIIWECQRHGYP